MIVPEKKKIPSEASPEIRKKRWSYCHLPVRSSDLPEHGWLREQRGIPPQRHPRKSTCLPRQVVGIGRIEPELRFLDLSSETTGSIARINFCSRGFCCRGRGHRRAFNLTGDGPGRAVRRPYSIPRISNRSGQGLPLSGQGPDRERPSVLRAGQTAL